MGVCKKLPPTAVPTVRIGSKITIHSRRRADLAVSAMETNAPSSAGGVYLTMLFIRPPHPRSPHRLSTRSPVDKCQSTHLGIREHLRVNPADHFRTVFLLLLGSFANLAHSGRTDQGTNFREPAGAEVGLPRRATMTPVMGQEEAKALRKRLPAQVGRCLEGVEFPARWPSAESSRSFPLADLLRTLRPNFARWVPNTTRRLRVTCRAAIREGTTLPTAAGRGTSVNESNRKGQGISPWPHPSTRGPSNSSR